MGLLQVSEIANHRVKVRPRRAGRKASRAWVKGQHRPDREDSPERKAFLQEEAAKTGAAEPAPAGKAYQ